MISLGVRAGRSADLKEASDRMKSWVRQLLSLPNDAVVTVSEITCRDVKCPGVETAILVMPPGEPTRLVKIPTPLLDVQLDDIEAALK
ncbi:MAG: nitrate reductase [Methylocystis sp.]